MFKLSGDSKLTLGVRMTMNGVCACPLPLLTAYALPLLLRRVAMDYFS